MASCQEDQIPAPSAESDANSAPEAVVEAAPATSEAAPQSTPAAVPLAKAIEEEEKKAAARYGNMRKKQSDVMKKRMMGGGKQYFDSGDYNLGKSRPNAQLLPRNIPPEQPAFSRLQS